MTHGATPTPRGFDAWLFDLDGVVTDTVPLHARAWGETFDAFLRRWSDEHGQPFAPFTERDYADYVDGKPRLDGVRDFLASRGVTLPEGSSDDPENADTVHALGARKNAAVRDAIAAGSFDVYPTTVALVRRLRASGVRTAIVSSSRNAPAALRAAGIDDLFEVCVDGNVAAAEGLRGKPAPDAFLTAADILRVPPERAVVVEDAISGVEAGRAGRFGLVIGVARRGDTEALRSAGADVVVSDLGELAGSDTGGVSR